MIKLFRRFRQKSRAVPPPTIELPVLPRPVRGVLIHSQAYFDRERYGWCSEHHTFAGDPDDPCRPPSRHYPELPVTDGAPDRPYGATIVVNGHSYMKVPPRQWSGHDRTDFRGRELAAA